MNHSLAATRPSGLEGTREFLATSGELFRTDQWQQSIVVAEGDYLVQYGVREGNWPGGPYFGFELAAGHYTREMSCMYRLVDGRIAERWAVRDDLSMLVQLGAVTPATPPARRRTSSTGSDLS